MADTLPGYAIQYWTAIFAPAGTPKEIVERIAASLQIRLQGSLQKRFIALTPLGTPRPTSFATRGTANVVEMPGARPLVVGLKGLASFSAPLAT